MNTELIARLEAAEVGRDDLDVEIARVAYAVAPDYVNYDPALWVERNGSFTTSLDAALALAERVLGDVVWCLLFGGHKRDTATVEMSEGVHIHGDAETIALALCIAILRALDSQVDNA